MSPKSRRVLIVNGSPRKRGNSATLASQVGAGAAAAGAQVETVFLQGMDIRPCTNCDACQKKGARGCVVKDEMQELYPKLRSADALVLASPIYWFTMSAQMKLFMDRWYALGGDPGGNTLKGKRIGIVLAYADVDAVASGAINAIRTYQDAFAFIGATIVGMVYGTAGKAGEIAKNKELMGKARQLGKALAEG
jgi:multimeric flavodoxin WrbA